MRIGMELVYDGIAKTFTLITEEAIEFLGPLTYAFHELQHRGFTASQSREAVLAAIFGNGLEVDLERIKKVAAKESAFYQACA